MKFSIGQSTWLRGCIALALAAGAPACAVDDGQELEPSRPARRPCASVTA